MSPVKLWGLSVVDVNVGVVHKKRTPYIKITIFPVQRGGGVQNVSIWMADIKYTSYGMC